MARVFSFVAALAVCLIATSSALTLDEIGEEFGNAPQAGLSPGQLAILNDPHRVYLYHVASDGYKSYVAGYFQGDTAAAQDALRKFAALDKGLDVVLLPGPREVTTIAKKKRVNADWESCYVNWEGYRKDLCWQARQIEIWPRVSSAESRCAVASSAVYDYWAWSNYNCFIYMIPNISLLSKLWLQVDLSKRYNAANKKDSSCISAWPVDLST